MAKNKFRKVPEYSSCQCGAVAVVMGGENPKCYLVDKGVCIRCVADIVGRYSAEASYKRLTGDKLRKPRGKKNYRPKA